MCEPASMAETAQRMIWSKTTDSHSKIIAEQRYRNACRDQALGQPRQNGRLVTGGGG